MAELTRNAASLQAAEIAPSPTNCVHQCQAQNRVRGAAVVLGFPFLVPDASRLPLLVP